MQHAFHRVPVTALAYYGRNHLFAGEGFRLRLYHVDSGARLKDVPIFERQSIHGIIVHDDSQTVLVWGGQSIRRLSITVSENGKFEISLGAVQVVQDWILDAAFAPTKANEPPVVAAVSAHNALSLITLDHRSSSQPVPDARTSQVVSGSNCILYSAHITWLTASQCLAASGTAFGDVILWSTSLSSSSENGETHISAEAKTHYTFSAHEGSVFGVQLSSNLTPPGSDQTVRVLASCSDDRTIQLWNVSDLATESPSLTEVQRDTGFGSRPDQAPGAPPLLAKVMGHISRIWAVRFLRRSRGSDDGDEDLRVMSFGEDASTIEWLVQPNGESSALPFVLKQVQIETAHTGKNIWSVALSPSYGAIATGGADGAIALRSEASRIDNDSQEIPKGILGDGENFKSYCFIDDERLVSTTDAGSIVLIDLGKTADQQVRNISPPLPGLRGYSVVAGTGGKAFVAGADGAVYAWSVHEESLRQVAKMERKVAGLFACAQENGFVDLLITCVGSQTAGLIHLQRRESEPIALDRRSSSLLLPEGFVVTSCASRRLANRVQIAVGSRNGSMAVYEVSDVVATTGPIARLAFFPFVHGKEAVTMLRWSGKDDPTSKQSLFSTGRDGTFAIHKIQASKGITTLHTVHQLMLPFGPNIEGLHPSSPDELLVWGFKSKNFVAYNLVTQREILSIECGGVHRNWAYGPAGHQQGGKFVWTKASTVYAKSQTKLAYALLNSGGHGREIKAMAITRLRCTESSQTRQVIATGAEDTDIRLWTTHPESHNTEAFQPRCLHTLRKHNTGIQHLAWSADGRYLFSSGGFEEFFVWRISRDTPLVGGVGVVCASVHPRSGGSDLRIMGFDVQGVKEDKETSQCHDGRATACKVNGVSQSSRSGVGRSKSFVIAMAYSDSTVKIWLYNDYNSSGNDNASHVDKQQHQTASSLPRLPWKLLASGNYLTACLTQAKYVHAPLDLPIPRFPTHRQGERNLEAGSRLSPSSSSPSVLLTASTDGHLTLWPSLAPRGGSVEAKAIADVEPMLTTSTSTATSTTANGDSPETITWFHRFRVHQSAVLALASYGLPAASCATRTFGATDQAGLAEQGGGLRKTAATVVVTGGDDNALGISLLRFGSGSIDGDSEGKCTERGVEASTLIIPRAHAAAVTGVAISSLSHKRERASPDDDDNEKDDVTLGIISTGVDQRVKQWELTLNLNQPGVDGLRVRTAKSVGTAVADVSGLEVCSIRREAYNGRDGSGRDRDHGDHHHEEGQGEDEGEGRGVLVCGVGMEAWSVVEW